MRNDPVVTNPLDVRIRACVLQTWHIEPDDETDKVQVEAAADIEARIEKMPEFHRFLTSLMDAIWFGRMGCQVQYEWDVRRGVTGIRPTTYEPINGDKLIFGFGPNKGKVGVRVWPSYGGPTDMTDYGMVHWFDGNERNNLVVHRHIREDSDFRRPQKAGSIEGVGLRNQLYWFWALKNEFLSYLSNYAQWFSRGLTIYYFDAHNSESLQECRDRINEHTKSGLPILLFPKYRDGNPDYKPVERIEPGQASSQFLLTLITEYFDDLFRRTILGQSLTTTAEGGGFGGSVADAHETTFGQVVKFDSNLLQSTLTSDLVSVMYKYTYPALPPGRFEFETEAPNVEQLVKSASAFIEMGGTIDGGELRKVLGLPLPGPGAETLGGLQPMQASGVAGLPQNVPAVSPNSDPESTGPVPSTGGETPEDEQLASQ